MNIGEVLNGVYDDDLGWRPASKVKPVHIANGLVRAIAGARSDITPLIEMIAWEKGGAPIEDRRHAALLERDWAEAIRGLAESPDAFDRARRYLRGILAADGAVFPSPDFSSLTLTCAQMASGDRNDFGLGEFGLHLMSNAASEGLPAFLADRLKVKTPTDPITIAAWPLLRGDAQEVRPTGRSAAAMKKKHSQTILANLRQAAGSLETHERVQGNRLRSLERAVHFVCVATLAHAQAVSADGKLDRRAPALLVTDVQKGTSLATSSERSLKQIYDAFSDWLARRLGDRLEAGRPLDAEGTVLELPKTADGREVRKLLRTIGLAKSKHEVPDDEVLEERMSAFNEARLQYGKDDVGLVLGKTLVDCYLNEYLSGGPRDALTRIGARAGLLYPSYQGRSAEKRYQPTAPVLDMLVRGCVPEGPPIPLGEFLERLWHRFGLIVVMQRDAAGGWDDATYLHEHNLSVDAHELRANTEALISQLSTMGLARRYPDNVTFVGASNVG